MDFSYTAVNDFGQRISGTAIAESEEHLASILSARGEHLVAARKPRSGVSLGDVRVLERVKRRDVIFFTSQLGTVMATGINLVDGLRDIEARIKKQGMREVVSGVRRRIESGLSLSEALAGYPDVFDEMYVNVVKVGEATGRADKALEDLVTQLEWQEQIRNQVREAATYPVIVICLLICVVVMLVGWTIPKITQLYANMAVNITLPLPTRIVMAVTGFITGYWLTLVTGLIAALIALRLQWQTQEGKAMIQGWILRIPVIGELTRKVAFSRFAHFFATLHTAGLEVAPSLTLIQRMFGNEYLAREFGKAVRRVMSGESLSRALASLDQFPPVVVQMIALGEKSGRMDRSLEDVRRYYDKEVDRGVKQAITVFGPVMMLILALVFVLMAVSFYLPLFRLVTAMPRR